MGFLGKWLAGPHLAPPTNLLEAFWLITFRVISGAVWSFLFACGLLVCASQLGFDYTYKVEFLLRPAAIAGFIAGFFFGLELLDLLRQAIDRK